jgi:hypothetical protein
MYRVGVGATGDQVTNYRQKKLADFAEEIGIKADRLNRCRSVYRAYKDKDFKGAPPKFALLQSLQGHPQRYEIIDNNPHMTEREGRDVMHLYRVAKKAPEQGQSQGEKAQGQEEQPEPTQAQKNQEDWRVGEARRWFAQAVKHAQDAIKYGHPAAAHLDPVILRDALDDLNQQMAALRLGGRALIALAIKVKRALASPTPPPMFDDDAPVEFDPPDDDDALADDDGDAPTKH